MTTDDELARAEYVQATAYPAPTEPPRPEWVTVLASGGDTVYLFDARHKAVIGSMEAVLDMAYPAAETVQQTIRSARWPEIRDALIEEGMEIVDRIIPDDVSEEADG